METVKIGTATMSETANGYVTLYGLFLILGQKNEQTLREKFNLMSDVDSIEMTEEMLNNGLFSSPVTRQNFRRTCQLSFVNKHKMVTGLDVEYNRTDKVYHVVARMIKSTEEVNKRGEIVTKKIETETVSTSDDTPTDSLNRKHTDEIEELKSKHVIQLNNLDSALDSEQVERDAVEQEKIIVENKVRELEKTLSIIITAVNDTKVTRKELIKMVSNI